MIWSFIDSGEECEGKVPMFLCRVHRRGVSVSRRGMKGHVTFISSDDICVEILRVAGTHGDLSGPPLQYHMLFDDEVL